MIQPETHFLNINRDEHYTNYNLYEYTHRKNNPNTLIGQYKMRGGVPLAFLRVFGDNEVMSYYGLNVGWILLCITTETVPSSTHSILSCVVSNSSKWR